MTKVEMSLQKGNNGDPDYKEGTKVNRVYRNE